MTTRKASLVANFLIVMVLLTLLTAVALFTVSPWYYLGIGRPPILRIGFVSTRKASLDGLVLSVEAAVADINHSVRQMSPSPPEVLLERTLEDGLNIEEQFLRLFHDKSVGLFLVPYEDDAKVLSEAAERNGGHDIAIVTLASLVDMEARNVISMNMEAEDEIRGYLKLMASNNPTDKPLEIVPVWENKPEFQGLYDFFVAEAEANFTQGLKLTLPVTYEASQYPSADGMQAVSELGSRLVMHPDAHIFFLTSSRLKEVIDASVMNRELSKRRWYARGLQYYPRDLEAIEAEATEFSKVISFKKNFFKDLKKNFSFFFSARV